MEEEKPPPNAEPRPSLRVRLKLVLADISRRIGLTDDQLFTTRPTLEEQLHNSGRDVSNKKDSRPTIQAQIASHSKEKVRQALEKLHSVNQDLLGEGAWGEIEQEVYEQLKKDGKEAEAEKYKKEVNERARKRDEK